ncbi:hypothetical protein CK203_041685 [Vitis vinifera]|uniref:Uncharacterized protein n=1 Tax=Vitis vinifera TaxID=29760 RepID=A0A438HCU6_VITVI|nr:hypothetical protein CK203_041685 [Vitis vinifera]
MLGTLVLVDIICMTTDVMCIIREDYHIPHVEHGGGTSPTQSTVTRLALVRDLPLVQPPTSLDPPSVQPSISLNLPSVQASISLDSPSAQPSTFSDPLSVQPPAFLNLPPLQLPTSSDSPSVEIDTSTQLDLLSAILRDRRGLRRPRLLPPPPPLFPAVAPSQTNVLHVSHAIPATVRKERPKKEKSTITHSSSL